MILIEEKYKIYKVSISQTFNVYWHEGKYFRKKKCYGRGQDKDHKIRCILAKSKNEAIELYKSRYEWNYDILLTSEFMYEFSNPCMIAKEKDIKSEVVALECHPTFDVLKKELRADELFTYCKQEMYPIEIIMK